MASVEPRYDISDKMEGRTSSICSVLCGIAEPWLTLKNLAIYCTLEELNKNICPANQLSWDSDLAPSVPDYVL